MLKLRINRLLSVLESINADHPGIIKSELENANYPSMISHFREVELKQKINLIIDNLSTLSKLSKGEIYKTLLIKYTDHSKSELNLMSTSAYGRIIGIEGQPYLFDILSSLELIEKPSKSYLLTSKGKKYGGYLVAEDGGKFIGWNKELLDPIMESFKLDTFRKLKFRLYHMTHISNLDSILSKGLNCHNLAVNYFDISNPDVNTKRNKIERYHKNKIHDYVPLYFNPRNAMLYQIDNEYKDEIVILEMDIAVVNQDLTLFCQGNAARSDSNIEFSKIKLQSFQWEDIYASSWADNGNVDDTRKSLMMSECLIYKHMPESFIQTIHCKNQLTLSNILKRNSLNTKKVKISPELYF